MEQRMLRIQGRADISLPEGVAPLYLEYQPGDYERAFTLSDASIRPASRRGSATGCCTCGCPKQVPQMPSGSRSGRID